MSARQPFFPHPSARSTARTEPASGSPTFTPDLTNSLHGGAPGNASAQLSSALDGKPATSGLGVFKKRKSNPDGSASNTQNGIFRPGTADPHSSRALQALSLLDKQQGIVQPTPQRAARPASALLFVKPRSSLNNNAFKVPDSVSNPGLSSVTTAAAGSEPSFSEKDAHISNSDTTSLTNAATSNGDENELTHSTNAGALSDSMTNEPYIQAPGPNLKFNATNASVNQSGPRRIFVEAGSAHYQDDQRGPSTHEITEDGRVKWNPFVRKRTIEEVEEDEDNYGYENRPKRLKGLPDKMADENRGSPRNISPIRDRPSSGLSHSADSRTANSQVRESPVSHLQARPQSRQTPSRQEYTPYDVEGGHQRRRQGVAALDGLLGQDTDAFVREYMDIYDQLVQKWSHCTMEEWSAGADEIAGQYCKILDYVKDYVTDKVKLLGNLHKDIGKHDTILDERSRDLSAAKNKLIQDSGSFLGK